MVSICCFSESGWRFERSLCLLLHIEPFGKLSFFVPVLSLVYRCYRSLLFHYFSAFGIDLWGKGDPFHRQSHLSLDPFLNAAFLFLLPLRDGCQKFIAKRVLLAWFFEVSLLKLLCDCEVCLVFFQTDLFEGVFPEGPFFFCLCLEAQMFGIFS